MPSSGRRPSAVSAEPRAKAGLLRHDDDPVGNLPVDDADGPVICTQFPCQSRIRIQKSLRNVSWRARSAREVSGRVPIFT